MQSQIDLRAVALAEQGVQELPGIGAFTGDFGVLERAEKLHNIVAFRRAQRLRAEAFEVRRREDEDRRIKSLPRELGGVVLDEQVLHPERFYTVGGTTSVHYGGTAGSW